MPKRFVTELVCQYPLRNLDSLCLTKLAIGGAHRAKSRFLDRYIVVLFASAVFSGGLADQILFFNPVENEVIFVHILKERVSGIEVVIRDSHFAIE